MSRVDCKHSTLWASEIPLLWRVFRIRHLSQTSLSAKVSPSFNTYKNSLLLHKMNIITMVMSQAFLPHSSLIAPCAAVVSVGAVVQVILGFLSLSYLPWDIITVYQILFHGRMKRVLRNLILRILSPRSGFLLLSLYIKDIKLNNPALLD